MSREWRKAYDTRCLRRKGEVRHKVQRNDSLTTGHEQFQFDYLMRLVAPVRDEFPDERSSSSTGIASTSSGSRDRDSGTSPFREVPRGCL